MIRERRTGSRAIPQRLERTLTHLQLVALRKAENFGWQLKFVRRPLFQDPMAVIADQSGEHFGVLRSDGQIDFEPQQKFR